MTDEELKKKLLAPVGVEFGIGVPMGIPINPDGKAAWARIEELEARQGWQPIETAPKDGTMVFVWFPDSRTHKGEWASRIKFGKFVEDLQEWAVQDYWSDLPLNVTHWRPLFDPPKGTNDAP